MDTTERTNKPGFVEFVIIVSMMMSITALSIDAMLPALAEIGSELHVARPNDRQLVISIIFLGQGFGQLFFGPLSDKTGRKPAIVIGYGVFIFGSLVSALAMSFPMMLVGRALQGLGVSGPRAVTLALVRDRYEGRNMARVMSFAMTVFILVPAIAPSIGQAILAFTGWRWIFGAFVVFALGTVVWFVLRMPETLAPERRIPFTAGRIWNSAREIFSIRPAIGFTIASGLVYGAFTGYLNSSQQIFQELYALGAMFPIYFSFISLALGTASFLNARLVMRYGMHSLVRWALWAVFSLALIFFAVFSFFGGQPPLWLLMTYFMLSFFCVGILFGNINTLAMQPLGHLAGIGSAVVGSFSTLLSMVLGMLVGRSYDGTVLPLVAGLALLNGIAILVARWAVKA